MSARKVVSLTFQPDNETGTSYALTIGKEGVNKKTGEPTISYQTLYTGNLTQTLLRMASILATQADFVEPDEAKTLSDGVLTSLERIQELLGQLVASMSFAVDKDAERGTGKLEITIK